MMAVDGGGNPPEYADYIQFVCDLADCEQCRCPHAFGEIMPMQPGTRCIYKDGTECRSLEARLDAVIIARARIEGLWQALQMGDMEP